MNWFKAVAAAVFLMATPAHARYYEPETGRFLEEDPIPTINQYAYANNNPLKYVDPLGLMPINGGGEVDISPYLAPNGRVFYAPAGTNFQMQWQAGQANGMINLLGINNAIGHYGTFDYQRPPGEPFNSLYTNASNFGVGVYMEGAGFSLQQTIDSGSQFATGYSSNAGSQQAYWWTQGWMAARNKNVPMCSSGP